MNTSTKDKLQELIEKHSDDSLAKLEGMVYQVWSDGEITLQKSGSLLGQRSLHCIMPGILNNVTAQDRWPHHHEEWGFIFTTREGADEIRQAIMDRFAV